MSDTYSYEDVTAFIDTQCEIRGDSRASCPQNTNKTNFERYLDVLKKQGEKGEFNLFEVIYPNWWHENFHSKMLKFLLENYRDFFDNFLDLIDKKKNITKENYKSYTVQCEYPCKWEKTSGRIDLAIFSEKDNRVIIIENKLNWAGDQDKQIYRYYKAMTETKIVDKIVYLSPSKNKKADPTSLGFGKEEYNEIEEKLVHLIGFNGTPEGDLVSCLEKTEKDSLSEDKRVFLNHYIEILKQTGVGDMSVIAQEFFEKIQNSEDKEIGKKLAYMKEMLDNIPKARMEYWLAKFESCKSFNNPLIGVCRGYNFYVVDVEFSELAFSRVVIYTRKCENIDEKREHDEKLKGILGSEIFEKLKNGTHKGTWYKDFKFPTEDNIALEFVQKVDAILSNLKAD